MRPVHSILLSLLLVSQPLRTNALQYTPVLTQPSTHHVDRVLSDRTLPGLLTHKNPRQTSCPSGYGLCSTGICCPLGDHCCKDGDCCRAGYFCHPSGGCCLLSERTCYDGCMPAGATCCSNEGYCTFGKVCAVYDGKLGCCPIGEICSGDPGDPTTSIQQTSSSIQHTSSSIQETSSTRTSTSTIPKTTFSSNQQETSQTTPKFSSLTIPSFLTSSFPSFTLTSSTSTFHLTASPAATTGFRNTTWAADNSNIIYSSDVTWTSAVAIACSSYSGKTKKTSEEGGIITFTFSGTAVYLTVTWQSLARPFSVSIDGKGAVVVNSYASREQCAVAWAALGLSDGTHTVHIVTLAPDLHSGRRDLEAIAKRQSQTFDFELANLVYS